MYKSASDCSLWSHPPRWPITLAVDDYAIHHNRHRPTHQHLQFTCVRFNAPSTTPTQRPSHNKNITDTDGRWHGRWIDGTFTDTRFSGSKWSGLSKVSRHFGPRTLRTQDISALSDWCRSVRTVQHQCRSVFWTLRHNCLDLDNTSVVQYIFMPVKAYSISHL